MLFRTFEGSENYPMMMGGAGRPCLEVPVDPRDVSIVSEITWEKCIVKQDGLRCGKGK